ncbi:MAG: HAMP domain-containing sensor histidine kinase [Steroidobacteraceae bacterium]
MPRISARSISLHIIISTVTVLLTLALLVGWTLVIVQNMSLRGAMWGNTWLLVGGIAFFIVIMSVLVMFSVFLVREILEVRRQQTFIDSVTHELKSPLASIKLCLDTLARPELSHEQRERLRQMMLGDVDRLSVFVDDILEASQLSHGRRTQSWTVVSVPALVQRCVEMVRRRYNLDDSAIAVEVDPDISLPTDPTALETILKNLLDNAVKYSGSSPRVTLTVHRIAGDQLELAVSDNGIGIAKAHLKRIFKRFYRVPSEEVYARSGTGLGLYVVAALVRNLGGRIEARSTGIDGGTCMSVRLPLTSVGESTS